jgi:hypothetical protein
VFGGDNIPDAYNSDPDAAANFRNKLRNEFRAVIDSSAADSKDVVVIGA